MAVVEESNVPIKHFRPTHVANCFDDAIAFAKMGGNIDFTSGVETSEVAKTLAKALELAPLDKITLQASENQLLGGTSIIERQTPRKSRTELRLQA